MDNYLDKTASLTPLAKRVICDKATEYPHTGSYNLVMTTGTYLCRRCGLALFRGESQFSSGCGWPSFDDNIVQAVKQIPDRDGRRMEILCSRCEAHLGHVFTGEYFTQKNLRHCVNSASIDFVADNQVLDTEEAILAGGCFWGVDHFLKQISGVLRVEVGYTGGVTAEPSYEQVCQGNTGHYEAVRVIFDKAKTDYHHVLKRFLKFMIRHKNPDKALILVSNIKVQYFITIRSNARKRKSCCKCCKKRLPSCYPPFFSTNILAGRRIPSGLLYKTS